MTKSEQRFDDWLKRNRSERRSRKLKQLVLFLSDVAYFAKRWEPIRVEFYGRQETKILWRISRKRHAIKAAILERKKQNKEITRRSEA